MYPAQTSLIPVTVALVRFFLHVGPSAFNHTYPYWYLGSTPYKYLIGPITPFLAGLANNLLPSISLFDILIVFVLLSFGLSAIGWGILVGRISGNKSWAYWVACIYLILPGKFFTALGLEEATFTIARNLLPFLFIFVFDKKRLLSIACLSLILLINTSILTQVLVGLGAISLNFKYFKRNLLIVIWSLLVVTIWYSPGYWFTELFNPSIGGVTPGRLFFRVFEFARNLLPILLAFFVVRAGKVKRTALEKFGLVWFGIFAFLTLYRFMADANFWSDWTAWLPDLEIGFAILVIVIFQARKFKYIYLPLALVLIPLGVLVEKIPLSSLVTKNLPEIYQSLTVMNSISKDKNVFLSGTTVFWADAFYDIKQVRGGRDPFSVHPTWDKASYELREGTDARLTENWLTRLDINYVLVHTESSAEFYHDFKNIDKWNEISKQVWADRGDIIYKID